MEPPTWRLQAWNTGPAAFGPRAALKRVDPPHKGLLPCPSILRVALGRPGSQPQAQWQQALQVPLEMDMVVWVGGGAALPREPETFSCFGSGLTWCPEAAINLWLVPYQVWEQRARRRCIVKSGKPTLVSETL